MPDRETPLTFRQRLAAIVNPYQVSRNASKLSLLFDLFIILCIFLSCALVAVEWRYPESTAYLTPVEIGITIIFLIEYVLRWYVSPDRRRYPFQFLSIVDLLAVAPSLLLFVCDLFFIRELRTLRVFRLVRLLRLMRLFRLLRFSGLIYQMVIRARIRIAAFMYRNRARPMAKLLLWTLYVWVLGSNLLHFTESKLATVPGPFSNYWDSYWNSIIVLISGIEDKEPLSLLGRIEVTVMLILGVVIVGFITGEIVSTLVQRWQRGGLLTLLPPKSKLQNHIVILGTNSRLENVILQINAALEGTHFFLIVDQSADTLPAADQSVYRKVFGLVGDPSNKSVLDKARIDQAARIVVLARQINANDTPQDIDNRSLIVTLAATLRERTRPIPTVVEILDRANLSYARNLPNVDFVVGQQFGERLISQAVLHPGITEIFHQLLNFTDDSDEIYIIEPPKQLIGKRVTEARLFFLSYSKTPITLLAVQVPLENGEVRTEWGHLGGGNKDHRLIGDERLMVLARRRPKLSRVQENRWSSTFLLRN